MTAKCKQPNVSVLYELNPFDASDQINNIDEYLFVTNVSISKEQLMGNFEMLAGPIRFIDTFVINNGQAVIYFCRSSDARKAFVLNGTLSKGDPKMAAKLFVNGRYIRMKQIVVVHPEPNFPSCSRLAFPVDCIGLVNEKPHEFLNMTDVESKHDEYGFHFAFLYF